MSSDETTGEVRELISISRMDVEQMETAQAENLRLATLIRTISIALIKGNSLQESLQECTQALVNQLGAAFARIWLFNQENQMLELQASSGMYTHLNGQHSRIPLGALKIGLIAAERLPHLTNAVIGDPRVSDQEWARREGMVAFAGYPLLIEGNVVGVMALFARSPLSPAVLDAMASISNAIALGIVQKRMEEERARLLELTDMARVQAETALQIRTIFLSSVSHDLKTPLTAISGNVQMLQRRLKREDRVDVASFSERLGVVESSVVKMTGMIEDLLGVAKLQAGQKLELDMHPVQFTSLVQQVCAEQQETTRRHRIELQVSEQAISVRGDAGRLERVLANLIGNAIKYNPEGGNIAVKLAREEEQGHLWAVLSIEDQGVGIPADDLPHIFEPFHRASNVAGRIAGTGIGLASVAQVLAEHRGTVSVKSTEGCGSCFAVRLPCFEVELSTRVNITGES